MANDNEFTLPSGITSQIARCSTKFEVNNGSICMRMIVQIQNLSPKTRDRNHCTQWLQTLCCLKRFLITLVKTGSKIAQVFITLCAEYWALLEKTFRVRIALQLNCGEQSFSLSIVAMRCSIFFVVIIRI